MRSLAFSAISLCLLLLCTTPSYADDELSEFQSKLTNEWTLVKNDRLRNIKTYAKQEDGRRFRSFKVEATMNSTMETIARVLLDFESYKKWWWEVRDVRLIRKDSPTEYFVYMVHRAPYGLPDRDVILHVVIEPQSKTQKFISLKVRANTELLPLKPPLIRMEAEDMVVKFTPLPENRLLIEAQGYVDPGGRVPAWANNFIQRSAPYSILLGLQRMAQLDEYRESHTALPFPIDSTPE
ncbi:hypothetical protein C8N29_11047 [Agitococcus lubricus]|uniref:START domain-containing protein n=2 Tax=Agitococcus lubricus TaxID=1077255 RepID=A0A2T5IY50_9GAMM|nr:hypothetical protein C8N29_11047 [Agitococcus lubricus]